jgi:formate dehydrogenase maturation protein FdhE
MKKMIIAVMAVAAFTGSALAADTIEMKRQVTFKHKAHAEALKDCTKCHASAAGGKIDGFGKDFAHKTCKGCHAEMSKGPVKCDGCHAKK